jgi:uncharacterized YccA/Bax inhibitor family protein
VKRTSLLTLLITIGYAVVSYSVHGGPTFKGILAVGIVPGLLLALVLWFAQEEDEARLRVALTVVTVLFVLFLAVSLLAQVIVAACDPAGSCG